jgi:hypothetical protein
MLDETLSVAFHGNTVRFELGRSECAEVVLMGDIGKASADEVEDPDVEVRSLSFELISAAWKSGVASGLAKEYADAAANNGDVDGKC